MDPLTIAMTLAQFAPQVVRWISGSDKAAEAAGAVVDIATQVTGAATGSEAISKLTTDPALVLEFRRALAAQQADLDKAYLADMQQARQVHAQHWMPAMLTVGLAAMVTALVAVLVFVPMPSDNKEVIYLVAGQVIGAFSTAIAYWLGSSRGSAQKADKISVLLSRLKN